MRVGSRIGLALGRGAVEVGCEPDPDGAEHVVTVVIDVPHAEEVVRSGGLVLKLSRDDAIEVAQALAVGALQAAAQDGVL